MENRFYNRDFEDFVKRNADQYRMFPSEKVWKNIHHNLHTRRRWYGIGIGMLLLTMGTVTWVMTTSNSKNATIASGSFIAEKSNNTGTRENRSLVIQKETDKKPKAENKFISSAENLQTRIFLNNTSPGNTDTEKDEQTDELENSVAFAEPVIKATEPNIVVPVKPDITASPKQNIAYHKPSLTAKQSLPAVPVETYKEPVASTVVKASAEKTAVIPMPDAENKQAIQTADKKEFLPLTIESVVNSYQYRKPRKRLSWEIFMTPAVTYRKLSENKDFIASAQSRTNNLSYTAFTDINSLVTHKPDMGLQLGATAGYPLFKNVKLTGGLQFNVSKYDIKAYYSPSEVATIALEAGGGVNSVSTSTNYRNFNGTNIDWLRNLYFSASAPIGLEMKLGGNNKTQFSIRGTVQPTYILGNEAYLLSTDYKNYAEIPSLIRKFNVNTGIELFATYSTGRIKWKIGPQARFQAKSSFKATYPVKERLYDFGLKIGVILR